MIAQHALFRNLKTMIAALTYHAIYALWNIQGSKTEELLIVKAFHDVQKRVFLMIFLTTHRVSIESQVRQNGMNIVCPIGEHHMM
jgi:hypothetical protein